MLVGGLLAGLGVVTIVGARRLDLSQVSQAAKVGEWFFEVTVVVQLSMVLLAVPAAQQGHSARRWPVVMSA